MSTAAAPSMSDPPFACPPEKRHGNFKDLTGQRFGRWLVLRFFGNVRGYSKWICKCDCGVTSEVGTGPLRSGQSMSCGCAKKKQPQNVTHGLSHLPEYRIWTGMRKRCYNANCPGFKYYGGRGIQICEAWLAGFPAFYADMGPRPTAKHTIERVNVNGDYSPSNCVWLEARLQVRNRRSSRINRGAA